MTLSDLMQEILARRDAAERDDNYQLRCIMGEKIFYYPSDKAYVEGQIYTEEGVAEFRISQACEYHFDHWFMEEGE